MKYHHRGKELDETTLLIKLLLEHFTPEQIKKFLELLNDVCPYCYNRYIDERCQCWNDE